MIDYDTGEEFALCEGVAVHCDPLTAVQRANLARLRERRAAGDVATPERAAEAEARIDALINAQRWMREPCAPFARRCGT